MENPFDVLGFKPNMLRGLKLPQVQTLAKYAIRGWNAVHHPDVGGNSRKMVAVNIAAQQLENPDEFKRFLRQYTSRSRDADLQTELRHAHESIGRQFHHLISYNLAHFGFDKGPNIRTASNVWVSDVVAGAKTGRLPDSIRRKMPDNRFCLNVCEGIPTHHHFSKAGKIIKEETHSSRRMFGAVPEEVVVAFGGSRSLLVFLGLENISSDKDMKQLGGKGAERIIKEFKNRIPVEKMRSLATSLIPQIGNPGSCLFSLSVEDGEIFFFLEGQTINAPRK